MRGLGVTLGSGEVFDARSKAAPDVVLQARSRMALRQIHKTRRHEESFVHEVQDAPGAPALRVSAGEVRFEHVDLAGGGDEGVRCFDERLNLFGLGPGELVRHALQNHPDVPPQVRTELAYLTTDHFPKG